MGPRAADRRAPRRRPPWLGVMVLVGIAAVVIAQADRPTGVAAAMIQFAAAVVAVWATARAADRGHGHRRRAWFLLALAAGSWGLAAAARVVQLAAAADAGYVSAADWLRVPAAPLAVAGLITLSLPAPLRGASRARLEALVLGSSLLYLSWAVRFGEAFGRCRHRHGHGRRLRRSGLARPGPARRAVRLGVGRRTAAHRRRRGDARGDAATSPARCDGTPPDPGGLAVHADPVRRGRRRQRPHRRVGGRRAVLA
jgi:hypothetical protein